MKVQGFLCLFVIFLLSSRSWGDTIRIQADEWCPHNCQPKNEKPGYMIEIARIAFAQAGHKLEYSLSNWTRAITEARKGSIDGIVGAIPADAPDMIYHTEEAGIQRNTFFSRKDSSWNFSDLKSLEAVKLGVIQDYAYSDELAAYIKVHEKNPKRIQVTAGANALEQNIRKLQAGRIDTLVEDYSVFQYKILQMGLSEKFRQSVSVPMPKSKLYIGFSPKHPKAKEYAALLSKQIITMRAKGELAPILARYGLKDWQESP